MSHGAIPIDIAHKSEVVREEVLHIALQSRAALHVLLCIAAAHNLYSGRGTTAEFLHHKYTAIAEVNQSLSDPRFATSDGNITAVFTLLCIEETSLLPELGRDEEEAKKQRAIHLIGLRKMVELRGGITALQSAPVLQAFLMW